jgi:hypothetical protein
VINDNLATISVEEPGADDLAAAFVRIASLEKQVARLVRKSDEAAAALDSMATAFGADPDHGAASA